MSDRMQFWLGTVMLALAVGLLVGSFAFPRASVAQEEPAQGALGRYGLLTGVRGSVASTQTLYVMDDQEDMLLAFEYNSRSNKLEWQGVGAAVNLRRYANQILELRAKEDRRRTK